MNYTPLADPFVISFEKDGSEYEAKIIYAKSQHSCANFFQVEVTKPKGIEPFCLKEKPVHQPGSDRMLWVDEDDKQSVFYQLIGEEIAISLKEKLGVYLLDVAVEDDDQKHFNS